MSEANELCNVCQRAMAVQSCVCYFPPVPLCDSQACQDAHIAVPRPLHFPILLDVSKLQSEKSVKALRKHLSALDQVQQDLLDNIDKSLQSCSTLKREVKAQQVLLDSLGQEYTDTMQRVAAAVREKAIDAVMKVRSGMANPEYVPADGMQKFVWKQVKDGEDEVANLLTFTLKTATIQDLKRLFAIGIETEFEELKEILRPLEDGEEKPQVKVPNSDSQVPPAASSEDKEKHLADSVATLTQLLSSLQVSSEVQAKAQEDRISSLSEELRTQQTSAASLQKAQEDRISSLTEELRSLQASAVALQKTQEDRISALTEELQLLKTSSEVQLKQATIEREKLEIDIDQLAQTMNLQVEELMLEVDSLRMCNSVLTDEVAKAKSAAPIEELEATLLNLIQENEKLRSTNTEMIASMSQVPQSSEKSGPNHMKAVNEKLSQCVATVSQMLSATDSSAQDLQTLLSLLEETGDEGTLGVKKAEVMLTALQKLRTIVMMVFGR